MNETDDWIHIARLPQDTGTPGPPEALWLDTAAMRFLVLAVDGDGADAAGTPIDAYLAAHPARATVIRDALTNRFAEYPKPYAGARHKLFGRVDPAKAQEIFDRITPENRHPEIDMGPPVGKEEW